MQTKQTPFLTDEVRVSPAFNDLFCSLRTRYPRAYDLRASITNGQPLLLGKKEGILYEIKQDNRESYPKFHYVLWHGGLLREIYSSNEKAALIDSPGLFFISNERNDVWLEHVPIFGDSYSMPTEDVDHSDLKRVLQSRITIISVAPGCAYTFAKISRLKPGAFGVYCVGKSHTKKETIAFVSYDTLFNAVLKPLPLPTFDLTWQPGMEEGVTYLSDQTSIYTLTHDAVGSLKRLYQSNDPHVRLGKTHRWKYSFFEGEARFLIISYDGQEAQLSNGKHIHSGTGRNDFKYDDLWAPAGSGYLVVDQRASGDVYLRYRFEANARWHEEVLFHVMDRNAEPKLKRVGSNCYLSMNDEWYRITQEMLETMAMLS